MYIYKNAYKKYIINDNGVKLFTVIIWQIIKKGPSAAKKNVKNAMLQKHKNNRNFNFLTRQFKNWQDVIIALPNTK